MPNGNGGKRKVPRPQAVMVINKHYRIEWLDENEWAAANEDGDNAGVTRVEAQSIRLRVHALSAEQHLREILLHEVLHACWDAVSLSENMPDTDAKEEHVVSLMAPPLLFVLQQNPKVLAYLLDSDH